MSREHHDHDHDHDTTHGHRHHDAPHAGAHHAAAPGKRTLTAEASSDGAEANAASTKSRIDKMKQTVRDAYVGENQFANRGILHHKIDAVQELTGYLSHSEQSLGTKVLVTSLKIGAAAAGGALAASTLGAGVLAAGLIAGATGAATELPGLLGGGDPALDPDSFGSNYKAALREGWPDSVHKVTEKMNTLEKAKHRRDATLALRNNVAAVKSNMRGEMLDAWVNALKVKNQGQKPEEMGSHPFDKSTAGRLHIQDVKIHPHEDGATTIDFKDLKAKLAGVPKEARPQMLDRKIKDIGVARTIEGNGKTLVAGRTVIHTHFSFGIHPSGTARMREDDVDPRARTQLRAIDGASTWEDGLGAIWNRMQGQSLKSLGVSSIGS